MSKLWVDLTPLRSSPDLCRLFLGQVAIDFGRQVTVVAIPYQMFIATGSSLLVGLVSLVQIAPLVVGAIVGGSLADVLDRRRILMMLQAGLAVCGVGLAANAAAARPSVLVLFVLAALIGAFHGADSPTRSASVPRLVLRSQVPAAFALQQLLRQSLQAIAPAVTGLVIAVAGTVTAYLLNVVACLVATVALSFLRPLPPERAAGQAGSGSVREGLSYLRRRPVLMTNFAVDLNAMLFAMPRALFPEFGTVVLGGSAAVVGWLYAAPGVGALVGATLSGWVGQVRRQGRAVMLSVAGWGVAMILFSQSRIVALSLLLLALAGVADVISSILRTTILQLSIPDALRGRLSAIHTSVVVGGPRAGDGLAGGVAAALGAPLTVGLGGALCVLGLGVLGRSVPAYWRYRSSPEDT